MAEPIGTVSDFGGRAIHWGERPGEGPTVVFVNGCGLAREHWGDVVDLLPDLRTVTFDRPGMGGTRWPGTMPMLAEEVLSLRELVDHTGAPAVVVAHSMAAFHAEALARLHPELVAGVVMVDGSVEYLARRVRPRGPGVARFVRRASRFAPVAWGGVLTHRVGASLQSRLNVGHDWDRRFGDLYRDPDALAMGLAEAQAYWTQAWDLLELRARTSWPGTPVVVLTASQAPEAPDWVERQHRYATQLGGRQVVVDDSRHLMMIDRPEVIAEAVRAVR
ncbi:alpha/beta hydrolase [Mariniluteicoccus endophyticus]